MNKPTDVSSYVSPKITDLGRHAEFVQALRLGGSVDGVNFFLPGIGILQGTNSP